ncbi:MAG: hypothetical protein KJ593_03955 [Candidatus Omnitrophica bacterium]|nr:hypothetical protein [Candidatus Omnitrophota bacterium]
MNINNKRILIPVILFLAIGLFVFVLLSLRVNRKTKSILQPPSQVSHSREKLKTKDVSIYGLDIPFSATGEVVMSEEENKTEKEKKRTSAVVPKESIKTFQQEEAELAAGLQPKRDYSVPRTGDFPVQFTHPASSAEADDASAETDSSRIKELESSQEDDDLHDRGTILF